jgi:hypothetical protein
MTRARDLAAGTFELATGGVLKLETSDTTVTDGSVLGKIEFKAPDEASGTDAILVGAAIEAVAEGTFAADNNATELVFKTGASAAADAKMTLDSSGNVLVGKSAPDQAVAGIELSANDYILVTSTGTSAYLNRISSNGAIQEFRKDGTTVGSIGTDSSSGDFYVQSQITNHAGLGFKVNEVLPRRNGYVDGIDSLGSSTYRFANLYLSGGVFLGGTGSANKLDDYEEGTCQLVHGGNNMSTTAHYEKIGRLVTVHFDVTSASGSTTAAFITGLPFSQDGVLGAVHVVYTTASATIVGGYVTGSQFHLVVGGSSTATNLVAGERIIGVVIYKTA